MVTEKKDMKYEPLPAQPVSIAVVDYEKNCPAERVLASILLIDEHMQRIQEAIQPHLTSLTMQRNALLERAKRENIREDENAVLLELEGRKFRNQITDNDAFELAFPEAYKQIRESQKKDIDDAHAKALEELPDSKIPLGLADKKVGEKKVTEFVGYQPTKITYEVRKRIKQE
jgi:hypothetical protein